MSLDYFAYHRKQNYIFQETSPMVPKLRTIVRTAVLITATLFIQVQTLHATDITC